MAYDPPGVEITQVQNTVSPNLTAPDLGAAVIAPAYVVVSMEGVGSYTYSTFIGSGLQTFTLSGLTPSLRLDVNSVYVDLVKTTGATTGRYHIENSQLTSIGSAPYFGPFQSFTIPSGLITPDWAGASVRVAYRALNTGLTGVYTLQAESDVDSVFGAGQGGHYNNPLPFSLTLALQNTTTEVKAVPIYVDALVQLTASGTEASEHLRVQNLLDSQEVYGHSVYSENAAIFTSYKNWVDSLSQAINKHERIVFVAPSITWKDTNNNAVPDYTTGDRANTASNMRDEAAVVLDRRVLYVRPEVGYYAFSDINVQELKGSTLFNVNGVESSANPVFAILSSSVNLVFSDGSTKFYPALTAISDGVYTNLKNATNQYTYSAYIPLPGYYLTPAIVGMVAGQNPEQGFTNLPIAGPSLLKFSNDFFSESQLNTIAAGGNYLVINRAGSFMVRHQLSTDMTSVESRELSITKSIDYVAKFIRNVLTPFIGRSLITPGFLSIVGAILNGLGQTLIKNGRINGFKVLSVTQDAVNPDTVNVSISVQPKYPVNYIKVNLIF